MRTDSSGILSCGVGTALADLHHLLVVQKKAVLKGLVDAVHVHKTAPVAGKKAGKILDQLLKFLKGKISAQNPGIRVKLDGIVEGICI